MRELTDPSEIDARRTSKSQTWKTSQLIAMVSRDTSSKLQPKHQILDIYPQSSAALQNFKVIAYLHVKGLHPRTRPRQLTSV